MTKTRAGLCALLCLAATGEAEDLEAEKRKLLALHEEFKAAHVVGDADTILARIAEDYVRVARGEVSHPRHDDMAARMQDYLGRTTFSEYRDLRDPIVRVSEDGTLGWVIVELQARGVQRTREGTEEPLDFVCAWVSLFEKRDGAWTLVHSPDQLGPAASQRCALRRRRDRLLNLG
jgi:ketosteroid isomerase-like protein